jgi:hypothetical protein
VCRTLLAAISSHQDRQAETRDFGGGQGFWVSNALGNGFEGVKWSWATLVEHLVFRGVLGL